MALSSSSMWDTIVVGAGIEGSATAYNLAKRRHRTLLIEQFSLPHTRGSSTGQSRVTRFAYMQSHYSHMMLEAAKIWAELERESRQQLYIKTGVLTIAKIDTDSISNIERSLKSVGVTCERMSARRLCSQYPSFVYDDSYEAVLDPTGGILRANKCLQAFQSQFEKYGGVIHDGEKVINVQSDGDRVHVRTSKSVYTARSVVVTAGPWTSGITEPLGLHLPLQPVRVTVFYWRRLSDSSFGDLKKCPIFIMYFDDWHDVIYGLPEFEYSNCVKVLCHGGENCPDPDRPNTAGTDDHSVGKTAKVIRDHLPGLELNTSITETCMYTETPDNDFILDTHPKWKNIIIGAGFSGHGFKLSPVVGKILADLAINGHSNYDLTHFAISRFLSASPSSPSSKL